MSSYTADDKMRAAREIFVDRANDLNGTLMESFTEAADERQRELANLAIQMRDAPVNRGYDLVYDIAHLVYELISDVCEPDEDDIVEHLDNENFYR